MYSRTFRTLTIVAAMVCATLNAFGATFYVSQSTGNDSLDGRAVASEGAHGPWKTLAKASSVKLEPGDQLLLKCGDIWDETLTLTGDGLPTAPITISSYGKGERPYIRRTIGRNQDCIVVQSASGYCFRDLELGYALTGISIELLRNPKDFYKYYRFENCFFHDLDNPLYPPAVKDESIKEGWALRWVGWAPQDIVVKNCIGLRTQGFYDDGGKEKMVFESNTVAHTGLNQVNQTWGKNEGIYHCVFVYNYPWTFDKWGTTQVLAGQLKADGNIRNEVIDNEFGWPGDYPGAPDGCGYDFEGKTQGVTFRNNFVHDSYGEAVLFMGNQSHTGLIFDNNILRNNVRFNPIWDFDVTVATSNTGNGIFSNNKFFALHGKRAFNEKPTCFKFVNNQENATGTFVEMPRVTRIKTGPEGRTYTLACKTAGAKIRITIDGSLPNAKSPLYTGPVTIRRSGVLNAKGFKKGYYPSYDNAIVAELREPEGRSPVAWWKLDEMKGETVADAAGANNGRLAGAEHARGRLGGALAFSGTNQAVTLGHGGLDGVSDTFTIAFWVNAKSIRASTPEVCSGAGITGVAWWKMDESTGVTLVDTCGGNLGAMTGCKWTEGKFGSALEFSAPKDAVSFNNLSLKAIADNFTVSFWAQPEATRAASPESGRTSSGPAGQRYALGPVQYGAASGGAGLGVSVGTNGVSIFELADNYLPSPLVADRPMAGWNLITVVYRDKQPSLYVNGGFVKTGIKSVKAVHPAFTLGSLASSGIGAYQGKLDDLRVYSRALTDAEIRELATKGDEAEVLWSLNKMAGTAGLPYALAPVFRGDGPDANNAGVGISVGTSGISVVESSDGYLPSVLVDNLPQKGWNHIAVVYRKKQPTLYVNGMYEKAGHTSVKAVHPVFNLGGADGLGYFAGKLEDVRVYNCALTDAEIQVLASGN